ncbi:hypothetical protein D3C87_1070390 [compost metagenome]
MSKDLNVKDVLSIIRKTKKYKPKFLGYTHDKKSSKESSEYIDMFATKNNRVFHRSGEPEERGKTFKKTKVDGEITMQYDENRKPIHIDGSTRYSETDKMILIEYHGDRWHGGIQLSDTESRRKTSEKENLIRNIFNISHKRTKLSEGSYLYGNENGNRLVVVWADEWKRGGKIIPKI